MSRTGLKASLSAFLLWLGRQWAEGEAIQHRIESRKIELRERHGFKFPGRWS